MSKHDIDFIRIFFPSPQEEEMAVRLASFLASVVGERIAELRPETKLGDCFEGVVETYDSLDTVELVMTLEEEFKTLLGPECQDWLKLSFREVVERAARAEGRGLRVEG